MSDPVVAAAREIIETALTDIRGAIDGATPDALNWRPAGDGTNSVAVLAAHALASTRMWICVALGAPLPPRDLVLYASLSDPTARQSLRTLAAAIRSTAG